MVKLFFLQYTMIILADAYCCICVQNECNEQCIFMSALRVIFPDILHFLYTQ